MSEVLKFICDKKIIFEPEKYVVLPGEALYVKDQKWAHYDKNGCCLYTSFDLKEFDGFTISHTSFQEAFYQMNKSHKRDHEFDLLCQKLYDQTERAIIIGGCGRSGTTLLLSMISAHSEIKAIEESFAFYPKPMRLRKLINDLSEAKIWCEKTPKNIRAFEDIKGILKEKAIFIHMIRDGRDVITSHHPSDASRYWVSTERWVSDVTKGLQFDAHIVKYEDLIQDPKKELKKILDLATLKFQENVLNPHLFGLENSDAWFEKAQPLNSKSIARWKDNAHIDIIKSFYKNEQALRLLGKLGYSL